MLKSFDNQDSNKSLDLSNKNLKSLPPIDLIENLTDLKLSNNPDIMDYQLLGKIKSLQSLDLSLNPINSLEFLSSLEQLNQLKLELSKQTDITALQRKSIEDLTFCAYLNQDDQQILSKLDQVSSSFKFVLHSGEPDEFFYKKYNYNLDLALIFLQKKLTELSIQSTTEQSTTEQSTREQSTREQSKTVLTFKDKLVYYYNAICFNEDADLLTKLFYNSKFNRLEIEKFFTADEIANLYKIARNALNSSTDSADINTIDQANSIEAQQSYTQHDSLKIKILTFADSIFKSQVFVEQDNDIKKFISRSILAILSSIERVKTNQELLSTITEKLAEQSLSPLIKLNKITELLADHLPSNSQIFFFTNTVDQKFLNELLSKTKPNSLSGLIFGCPDNFNQSTTKPISISNQSRSLRCSQYNPYDPIKNIKTNLFFLKNPSLCILRNMSYDESKNFSLTKKLVPTKDARDNILGVLETRQDSDLFSKLIVQCNLLSSESNKFTNDDLINLYLFLNENEDREEIRTLKTKILVFFQSTEFDELSDEDKQKISLEVSKTLLALGQKKDEIDFAQQLQKIFEKNQNDQGIAGLLKFNYQLKNYANSKSDQQLAEMIKQEFSDNAMSSPPAKESELYQYILRSVALEMIEHNQLEQSKSTAYSLEKVEYYKFVNDYLQHFKANNHGNIIPPILPIKIQDHEIEAELSKINEVIFIFEYPEKLAQYLIDSSESDISKAINQLEIFKQYKDKVDIVALGFNGKGYSDELIKNAKKRLLTKEFARILTQLKDKKPDQHFVINNTFNDDAKLLRRLDEEMERDILFLRTLRINPLDLNYSLFQRCCRELSFKGNQAFARLKKIKSTMMPYKSASNSCKNPFFSSKDSIKKTGENSYLNFDPTESIKPSSSLSPFKYLNLKSLYNSLKLSKQ